MSKSSSRSSAASSASDEDASTAATSSASSASEDDDEEAACRQFDARMGSIALGAGVHPAHVEEALDELANRYADADDLDGRTDAHHGEEFRRILADRPELHAHYQPPEAIGPHADHERVPRPPKGKTFAPGKKNTASRAELRKAGVRY
jgi:hypothetical protein